VVNYLFKKGVSLFKTNAPKFYKTDYSVYVATNFSAIARISLATKSGLLDVYNDCPSRTIKQVAKPACDAAKSQPCAS
jgi:hypothetical protein